MLVGPDFQPITRYANKQVSYNIISEDQDRKILYLEEHLQQLPFDFF